MTQQLSAHPEQTTQWSRVCPSTRTRSSVPTEPEPDPLPPQNSDRTRTRTKFERRPSMASSKSTSSMSVFDTVSLLQWRVWRSTSSEPVRSVSLLKWHSVLDTFSFLYTPCQYRAFALLEIWVVARVHRKLWALREWHARHGWSLSVVSTGVWDNCIGLGWNAKHWCEWLRAGSVFEQWACFNGVVKVNLFDERVRHSEPASMTYCRQSQPLYWASRQNELSSSEPATMAIQTLSTSLKIDPPAYRLRSSYGIAYNQHIGCINIPFYTHALILFNSAPPAAASAASAAASAASAAASAASAAAFQLELPRTMLIHNVFHLSLLWNAATDFLPGQKQTPSLPFIMNESRGMRG